LINLGHWLIINLAKREVRQKIGFGE